MYDLVQEAKKEDSSISVSGVLMELGYSKSGYYDYIKREKSNHQKKKEMMLKKIKEIHEKSYQIYGAPKITAILRLKGTQIAERTVGKYMKELGIRAKWVKHYTVTTVSEDFSSKLQNLLKREFNPERPNAIWCTDITYIWTYDDGFVYLTSIMDLYSRKIIAWVLTKSMEADEVLECIRKAKQKRNISDPLVIHSDRGVQFTSTQYYELTERMKNSYSRKGNPWDNACIESFHSLIKREWLNQYRIQNYGEAYKLCFEYIETFYNTVRIHSHCKYHSPNEYEYMWKKTQKYDSRAF